MRKFEKITFEQFKTDIIDNKKAYNNYTIPKRATKNSAGYDFYLLNDVLLEPGERKIIPTGIKAKMENNEFLALLVRSSLGFKYNIRLCNQMGIIDKDYYNNAENEGHIFVSLQNESDKPVQLKQNSAFVQGIFLNYLLTNDDNVTVLREGGIGSTSKEEKK